MGESGAEGCGVMASPASSEEAADFIHRVLCPPVEKTEKRRSGMVLLGDGFTEWSGGSFATTTITLQNLNPAVLVTEGAEVLRDDEGKIILLVAANIKDAHAIAKSRGWAPTAVGFWDMTTNTLIYRVTQINQVRGLRNIADVYLASVQDTALYDAVVDYLDQSCGWSKNKMDREVGKLAALGLGYSNGFKLSGNGLDMNQTATSQNLVAQVNQQVGQNRGNGAVGAMISRLAASADLYRDQLRGTPPTTQSVPNQQAQQGMNERNAQQDIEGYMAAAYASQDYGNRPATAVVLTEQEMNPWWPAKTELSWGDGQPCTPDRIALAVEISQLKLAHQTEALVSSSLRQEVAKLILVLEEARKTIAEFNIRPPAAFKDPDLAPNGKPLIPFRALQSKFQQVGILVDPLIREF